MKLTSSITDIVAPAQELREWRRDQQEDAAPISVLREELAAACEASLDVLAGTAMPDTCTLMFPDTYQAIWQLFTGAVRKQLGFDRFAVGLPRGFSKTTLIKLLVLYIILFTDRNFILVVCRTADLAESFLADVADMLNAFNIKTTFGDWNTGVEQETQDTKVFSFRGRNIILKAVGAGSKGVRGRNRKNRRPDVVVMDDMQDWDNAESPTLSDSLLTWMTGTLMKAGSKFRCSYIFVGNMYPFPGSILRKLKQNPTWTSFITGGILADGESIWPELQSVEQLLEEYANDTAMGKPEIFLAEVLNDETASGKSGIDISSIRPAPEVLFTEPFFGNFIIIDPANDKKNSDMTEIGYFEVRDAKPALVELKSGRWSPGDMIREALMLAMSKNCKVIAVESVAYQYSLLYWFEQFSTQYQLQGINFVELYPGMSKNARIREMLQQLLKGDLLLHSTVFSRVVYQITHWNPLKTNNIDDLLDILAYAYKVIEIYGHLIATDIMQDLNDNRNCKVLSVEMNSAF